MAWLSRMVCHAGQQTPSTNGAADTHDRANSLPFDRPVDGRTSNPEQVGELSGAVLAALNQGHQMRLLSAIELGLLATQTPFGLGDLHALLGAQPNQVRLDYVDKSGLSRVRWSRMMGNDLWDTSSPLVL